jgi:hypothetical protein
MRLGLRGQSRRVLALKGTKVVQRLQLRYEWSYLILAVSPLSGEIRWEWIERMRKEQIRPVLERWALETVVWDRAPSHRAKRPSTNCPPPGCSCRPTAPSSTPPRGSSRRCVVSRGGEDLRGPRSQTTRGRKLPPRAAGRSRAGQELVRLAVAAGDTRIAIDARWEPVMRATITQNRYYSCVR